MSRNNLTLYVGGALGLVRTAGKLLDESTPPRDQDPTTQAEGDDVKPKWVWMAIIGLLLALWATVVVIYPLFRYFAYARVGGKNPAKVLAWAPPQPPLPRNLSDPFTYLNTFQARDQWMLTHYGWVNRSQGIAAIPIDRAIQLLAQRGIPPSSPGGSQYYAPSAGSMETGLENKVEPQPR